jgi:pilus assembly protein CpaF
MSFYRDFDDSLEGVANSDLLKDVTARPSKAPNLSNSQVTPEQVLPPRGNEVNEVASPPEVTAHIKDGESATFSDTSFDELGAALRESLELAPTLAQKIHALNPGATAVEETEMIIDQEGPQFLRQLDAELRQKEKVFKNNTGRDPDKDDRERFIKEVVEPIAAKMEILPTILTQRVRELYSGLFGLERFLNNPAVSDVMINDHNEIFIEEYGYMRQVPTFFVNANELAVDFISRFTGMFPHLTPPDSAHPTADWNFPFTLPDGVEINVRVNVILGDVTVSGEPMISIRKPVTIGSFDHLATWAEIRPDDSDAAMSQQAVDFLSAVVKHRATIVIVGGTGSGKTSLLKALIAELRAGLRIVSIEESQELVLKRPNARGLVAKGELTLGKLVITAMRMRPDVILVGECRAPLEATQFLSAVNTGHDGSITTTHAQSAEGGLYRLLELINEASTKSSLEYAGGQIARGVDMVIFIAAREEEQPNGEIKRIRRIMEIATMNQFRVESGSPKFELKTVFGRYNQETVGIKNKANIKNPLRCYGFDGLAYDFVDKMESFGLTEQELRQLLDTSGNYTHSPMKVPEA